MNDKLVHCSIKRKIIKMSKKDFDEFLLLEEKKKKPTVDWDMKKEKWIKYIELLYMHIEEWLDEYIVAKKVSIEFDNINIYEEALGTYTVKELIINIGKKIAKITPVGTILIGTPGRADLSGIAGKVKFILADKNAIGPKIEGNEFLSVKELNQGNKKIVRKQSNDLNLIWKITSNPPNIQYTELNQDTFLQCLMEVINGKTF